MHSPNPGQPIPRSLPTTHSSAPSASAARSLGATYGGGAPSLRSAASASVAGAGGPPLQTSASAIAAFDPLSLMRPAPSANALKARTCASLARIRTEEAARDALVRRAHLMMLSLGRDFNAAQHADDNAIMKGDYSRRAASPPPPPAPLAPAAVPPSLLLAATVDEIFDPMAEAVNEADAAYERSLDQSRLLAQRISGSTHVAEVSSTHVQRLDVLLSRVRSAQTLVDAMTEKEARLAVMEGAMARGDLAAAADAVGGYEAAKRTILLSRRAGGSNNNSYGSGGLGARQLTGDHQTAAASAQRPKSIDGLTDESEAEDDAFLDADGDADGATAAAAHADFSSAAAQQQHGNAAHPIQQHQNPAGLNGPLPPSHPSSAPPQAAAKKERQRRLTRAEEQMLLQEIRAQLKAAMAEGRRDDIVRIVRLLAKVQPRGGSSQSSQQQQHKGKAAFILLPSAAANASSADTAASTTAAGGPGEACLSYVQWVCDSALKELTARVDGELKTIKGAKNGEQSHLSAASSALDHVVATLEHEEAFVSETFGREGLLTLLDTLHRRCTADVVRIIRDYLAVRKISSNGKKKEGGGGGGLSAHVTRNNAKRLDETLEEISHLVGCCHIYMAYVDDRFREAEADGMNDAAQQPSAGASSSNTNANNNKTAGHPLLRSGGYSARVTKDNPLFEGIQELLAVFIPMQQEYFSAAFSQSVAMDAEALAAYATAAAKAHLKKKAAAGGGNGATGGSAADGLFGTLNSLVGGATASGGDGGAAGELSSLRAVLEDPSFAAAMSAPGAPPPPEVVLVEDLFYVLRVAVHRAFSTRSSAIASSVLVAATATVTDSLAPTVLRHVRLSPVDAGAVLRGSPQALAGVLAAAGAASAGVMPAGGATSANAQQQQQQLRALAADLASGRNLYSPTLWLTPELLAREEGSGPRGGRQQQHFGGAMDGHHHNSSAAAALPPAALAAEQSAAVHSARLFQWVAAAFALCGYTRRIARDVEGLAEAHFAEAPSDLVRFREQRQEMEAAAFWLEECAKIALRGLGRAIADAHFVGKHLLKGFVAQRYDLSEAEFCALERLTSAMSTASLGGGILGSAAASPTGGNAAAGGEQQQLQPWVPALTAQWAAATRRLRAQLAQREELFELLMANIAERSATAIEHCILPLPLPQQQQNPSTAAAVDPTAPPPEKPMKASEYGALQFDKEVRQLRAHFLGAADGGAPVLIRERFARLSAIAALLLVDRLADAPDVCGGLPALTVAEKRRVLLMRVGLGTPAEIMALQL